MAAPLQISSYHRELYNKPTLTGWTPERVLAAQSAADGGALQLLADLVETMFADDRIKGVLKTRTQGLLGLPLHFIGGTEEARTYLEGTSDDKAKTKTPGEWYSMHASSELVKLLKWGIVLGIGLAQRIPLPRVVRNPQRYKLRTWSPRTLHYDFGRDVWRVSTRDGTLDVIGDEWILYTPYGEASPWLEGDWRALVFPWLLKHFALEDRGSASEFAGRPALVGKAPEGGTEPQRKKFLADLERMKRTGRIVLPAKWELEALELMGKQHELYTSGVTWADSAITITLAGQIVTTEGTTGFSSGNVQDQIKDDLITFDGDTLATTLKEQSTDPWAQVNYGTTTAAPWGLYNTKRPQNLEQMARTFGLLGQSIQQLDAAAKSSSIRINVPEIYAQHNLPVVAVDPVEQQAVPLTLAPTDVAVVVRGREARAAQGLGPFGDERDDLTIEQIRSKAKTDAAPPTALSAMNAQRRELLGYDPNQPRDGEGQWSDTGSGGGGGGGDSSTVKRTIESLPDAVDIKRPDAYSEEYRQKSYAMKSTIEKHMSPQARDGIERFSGNEYTLMRAAHTLDYAGYKGLADKLGKDSSEGAYKSHRASVGSVLEGLQGLPSDRPDDAITHTYRGLSVSKDDIDNLLNAKTYNFETLTSTSVDPFVAGRYTSQHRSRKNTEPVLMRIKRKKQSNSAHIESVSMISTERELLFGPASFKITGHSKTPKGTLVLDLEEE